MTSATRTLSLCLVLAGMHGCSPARTADPRPNVLLITVDTLRADHLGCYGYRLTTSPHIDALARSGVRFEDCTAQWPKTTPSVASLLSGLYPKTSGLRGTPRVVPPEVLVLSEIFAAAGYTTAAVVANFNVGRTLGFDQGFEHFVESWHERWTEHAGTATYRNSPGRVKEFTDAALVNEQALRWLRQRDGRRPFFLWLHYMEPHGPYAPPARYDDLFVGAHPPEPAPLEKLPLYQVRFSDSGAPIDDLAVYKTRYDREIRHFDDELGELLSRLDEAGLGEDTLIVFTADHGESLGEHGDYLEHGRLSYQPTAHVPLIFARPRAIPAGRAIAEPVGLIDIAPTLLELSGVPVPRSLEGRSLAPAIRADDPTASPSPVFMESGYDAERPQQIVRQGRWKLIRVRSPDDRSAMAGTEHELYDLRADPGELTNLAHEEPALVQRLSKVLDAWLASGLAPSGRGGIELGTLDPEAVEMLRALGYVE